MAPQILVSGLPGKMAQAFVHELVKDGIASTSFAFGSDKSEGQIFTSGTRNFELLRPASRASALNSLKTREGLIAVDFTKPDAAIGNIEFYCRNGIPFVMGTSGFDRAKAERMVSESEICAVIAPNMAAPLVVLQSILEEASKKFPGSFSGYSLIITESHQKTKVDKSATGLAFGKHFEKLGATMADSDFVSIRDPEAQRAMGVPEAALAGHGYHTYELTSADGTSDIGLIHNIRGRSIYARGTIPAIHFLNAMVTKGLRGKVFSMIDVLSYKRE